MPPSSSGDPPRRCSPPFTLTGAFSSENRRSRYAQARLQSCTGLLDPAGARPQAGRVASAGLLAGEDPPADAHRARSDKTNRIVHNMCRPSHLQHIVCPCVDLALASFRQRPRLDEKLHLERKSNRVARVISVQIACRTTARNSHLACLRRGRRHVVTGPAMHSLVAPCLSSRGYLDEVRPQPPQVVHHLAGSWGLPPIVGFSAPRIRHLAPAASATVFRCKPDHRSLEIPEYRQ